MGSIISLVTGTLGGIWGYIAAAVFAAALSGVGVGWTVHKVDVATIASMRLADANAAKAAIVAEAKTQKAQDDVDLSSAVAEAKAQQQIVTQTVTVSKEITKHVTDTVPCIPFGLVRVLNDAATGSDTANAPAAAGQSDDACSGISWRSFANDITDDYGAGRENAEQLNALEANVIELVQAANK